MYIYIYIYIYINIYIDIHKYMCAYKYLQEVASDHIKMLLLVRSYQARGHYMCKLDPLGTCVCAWVFLLVCVRAWV